MLVTVAKATEAAEVLGVSLEGLTSTALGKAYRRKAKDCHPDHHGSSQLQLWAKVSWAKEALERWLKATPPQQDKFVARGDCRACSGTGRVNVSSIGFGRPLTMHCVVCDGIGEISKEKPKDMESR